MWQSEAIHIQTRYYIENKQIYLKKVCFVEIIKEAILAVLVGTHGHWSLTISAVK